jgi:DNA-nicking Smr family endonuclease
VVEIDLHGLTHDKVKDQLENWIVLQYNMGNFPIRIITGHSHMMKKLLSTAVDNQKFSMKEEVYNSGATIVYK